MTKEQADRLQQRMAAMARSETVMSEKDVDVLGKLLGSEPLMKALAIINSRLNQVPLDLLGLDLSDAQGVRKATLAQGYVHGAVSTIAALFELGTEAEVEEQEEEPKQ